MEIVADTGTTHKGYLAIQYLAERLERCEKLLGERQSAFTPPTPEEVTAYAKSIGFDLDGNNFCSFYEARGWVVGKVKMRSWKACVRTWKSRRTEIVSQQKTSRVPDNLRTDHGL